MATRPAASDSLAHGAGAPLEGTQAISAPGHGPSRFRERALLVTGDVIALGVFAILGRRGHGEETGLAAIGAVAETALPFVGGWIAAMLLLRTVGQPPLRGFGGFGAVVRQTLRLWVVAFPIAAVLRAVLLGRFSPWTFYVVTFLVAFAFLVGWRLVYGLVVARRGAKRAATIEG